MIAADLNCEAGVDYAETPVYVDWEKDPVKCEFGKPDVKQLTHDPTFNWWDNYPPMPEEYEKWNDENSYGPEGWKPPVHKGLEAGEGHNWDWKVQ
jgi:hypothetical protein